MFVKNMDFNSRAYRKAAALLEHTSPAEAQAIANEMPTKAPRKRARRNSKYELDESLFSFQGARVPISSMKFKRISLSAKALTNYNPKSTEITTRARRAIAQGSVIEHDEQTLYKMYTNMQSQLSVELHQIEFLMSNREKLLKELDRLSELIEKQGGQGVGASTASSSK
jgi:hypothetical protein